MNEVRELVKDAVLVRAQARGAPQWLDPSGDIHVTAYWREDRALDVEVLPAMAPGERERCEWIEIRCDTDDQPDHVRTDFAIAGSLDDYWFLDEVDIVLTGDATITEEEIVDALEHVLLGLELSPSEAQDGGQSYERKRRSFRERAGRIARTSLGHPVTGEIWTPIDPKDYRRTGRWWKRQRLVITRPITTGGGLRIEKGTVVSIDRKFRGLAIRSPSCKACGVSFQCREVPLHALGWAPGYPIKG